MQKWIHYGSFIGIFSFISNINESLLLRYHVIKEYTILSALPPPLNLFRVSNQDLKPFNRELQTMFDK